MKKIIERLRGSAKENAPLFMLVCFLMIVLFVVLTVCNVNEFVPDFFQGNVYLVCVIMSVGSIMALFSLKDFPVVSFFLSIISIISIVLLIIITCFPGNIYIQEEYWSIENEYALSSIDDNIILEICVSNKDLTIVKEKGLTTPKIVEYVLKRKASIEIKETAIHQFFLRSGSSEKKIQSATWLYLPV